MNISLSGIVVKIGPERKTLFKIPDLKIGMGEHWLIKGSSGSGKTTFLHMLSGLFCPDEGSVNFGDTDLSRIDDQQRSIFRRQHLGLVFQKLNLIEHLTTIENIQLGGRNQSMHWASNALEQVGLRGRENDRVGVLSLGEQQRVAIARVLAACPKIIFADEPTSSLDEANAFQVIELLIKASQDKTLIVVSHDHRIEKYFTSIRPFKEIVS